MAHKNKTHSGSKKRFRTTAKGKVKRGHEGASHLLTKKTSKRRRKLRSSTLVKGKNAKTIKSAIGKK